MSIYEAASNTSIPQQIETPLYGSIRLGIMTRSAYEADATINVNAAYGTARLSTFTRGEKIFELSNHLGNVLVTISDKRLPVLNSSGNLSYYDAEVVTANDYYPFGMGMPGRKYDAGSGYRYGFNGKENDNEIKGEGNQQDYGMRIYDPRLGKFLSVDPIGKEYPWNSPYAFAENDIIRSIDLDGMEKAVISLNDKTITFKITMAVFTNRPDKEINGVKYQGGNIPEGCLNAVEVAKNTYNLLNAALKNESYSITPKSTARDQGELFGATDDTKTNQNFTVKFEIEILPFKDEDEMKQSESYNNSVKDGSFAGVMLFGNSSYATVDGKEQAVSLDKGDAGHQFGDANNKFGEMKGKAYLIEPSNIDYYPNIPHEVGHGLGLGHFENGIDLNTFVGTNGSSYSKVGLMGYNKEQTPQAPTKSEVLKILKTIRGEIKPKK